VFYSDVHAGVLEHLPGLGVQGVREDGEEVQITGRATDAVYRHRRGADDSEGDPPLLQ
jgi:hypothetical protein